MNVALLSQPQRELRAYLQRVAGDGGTVETPGEASTFVRRLRSAGVLGSTVIAGVAGGVKAGTLYSIIGPDLDVTRGTVKNRVNRAGVLSEVASGVPATDFAGGVLRGTTVEPSSRNEIRNNTMQGAVVGVVGSGGSLPTNLTVDNRGLSIEVTELGQFNGVDIIGLRFFGTGSSNGGINIFPDTASAIVASNGQTWTQSYWLQITNGSSVGVTQHRMAERTSGAGLVKIANSPLTLTGDFNRLQYTRTLDGGGTVERVQPFFQVGEVTSGQSYDFTVRIGLPQMELGSVATSVIKTTGSAQTRNADVITKTGLGSVLPQTEGWVYAEVDVTRFISAIRRLIVISNGSATNRLGFSLTGVSTGNQFVVGNNTASSTSIVPIIGKNKLLLQFGGNSYKSFFNGALIGSGAYTSFSESLNRVDLGNQLGSEFLNDPIHSYAIGSGSITDASAIQLTTL
jgi:hypothetical protein